MSATLALAVGAMVGWIISTVGFNVLERIKRGRPPREMISGMLLLWAVSIAVTGALFRAIPMVHGEDGQASAEDFIALGDGALAVTPTTILVTLFLVWRAERRFRGTTREIDATDVKAISKVDAPPPHLLLWERIWRALFGGIFFVGLVALNSMGPGFHLDLGRVWDVCLLRERSAAWIVGGYLILLASLVPRRWLGFLRK